MRKLKNIFLKILDIGSQGIIFAVKLLDPMSNTKFRIFALKWQPAKTGKREVYAYQNIYGAHGLLKCFGWANESFSLHSLFPRLSDTQQKEIITAINLSHAPRLTKRGTFVNHKQSTILLLILYLALLGPIQVSEFPHK